MSLEVSQLIQAGFPYSLAYIPNELERIHLNVTQSTRQLIIPCTLPESCLVTCACRQSASRLRPAVTPGQKLPISLLQSPAPADKQQGTAVRSSDQLADHGRTSS